MTLYSNTTLYEKFQNDCISRKEFSKLIDINVLQPISSYAFPPFISMGDGKYIPRFSGFTAETLAEKGELLFFENWLACDYEKEHAPLHMGCYVYKDFFVIIAEPSYNSDTKSFGQNYDIDPIAIPLSRVTEVSASNGRDGILYPSGQHNYRITISFSGGSYFTAKLFWYNDFHDCLVHDNWSLAVNSILCKISIGVQSSLADTITNQMKSALESVINKCTDYEKRRDIISNVISKSFSQSFEDAVYAPEHDFVKLLIQYRRHLNPCASQSLKEKLDSMASTLQKNVQTIEGLREKIKHLECAISKAESEKRQAGLFQKGKLKKEIKELSAHREQLLQDIKVLDIPDTAYSDVMTCFLATELPKNHTKQWSKSDTELAKKIYVECKERGISKISSDKEKIIFKIISNQCGINDITRAMKLFGYGKRIIEESVVATENIDTRKECIDLEIKYNKTVENSQIVGWDKYLTEYYERIDTKQKELAKYEASYTDGIDYAANSTSKPVDWAIVGGLAQGIAGPAAGIMAAAEVQIRNAQAEAASQKAREDGIKVAAYSSILAKKTARELNSILNEVNVLKNRLYDENHPQMYFDYLSCEVCSYSVAMENAMNISVEIGCQKKSEFNGNRIAIDGSIRVDVVDKGQVIANAFICADGFGITDFNEVGFSKKKTYSTVAMTTGTFSFKENREYTFRFSPEHIWMIEVKQ